MYQRTIFGLLCLFTGAVTIAQTVDYPVQESKTPEAQTAGIESYHLTREGEIVAAEVFGLEGDRLADCEAQWHEDSRVMTCTMSDGGRFRATWHWNEGRAEFEDLVTGDYVSIYRKEISRKLDRGNWDISGTKTWEEVERDWGYITPFFGSLLVEIEMTLGI